MADLEYIPKSLQLQNFDFQTSMLQVSMMLVC